MKASLYQDRKGLNNAGMSRWSRDSQVGRSLGAARPNPVRSEVADYESVNHSRKEDPLFGRSPPPGIDSNGPNPELRGSSRGNEPDYLRLQRVATEDAEDEDNYFYSRYESIKGIGWRRFRVEERRTVGEVLSDANKDGYQYALVTYGNQTYLLCRKRIIYGLDDLDLSTRQEGRIFALRDYYDDGQRFGNHATNERTGARLAIEVRAWFNQKEPIFRGRQFLPADYKLHSE